MSITFQRTAVLTAALVFAAGATALASVSIEPSNSITLQTRVKGMGGDIDRERVTIIATSHSNKVNETSNTCRGLVDVSNYRTSERDSEGGGQPSEHVYTASIHLASRSQEGSCVVTFSDGGHAAAVHMRIVKP